MTQTNTTTTPLVLEHIGKADLPPIEIGGSPLVIHFRKLKMNEKNSLMVAPAYQKAMAATTQHYQVMVAFVKAQMTKDIDYGVIPGTRKPTLLKAGAEKLCRLFNLRPHIELLNSVVDFEKPLFYFHYRCSLYRDSEMVGEADGCCNSMEVKYQKQK